MEIFDTDGKSLIDGKTVKAALKSFGEYILIAFSDKTYVVLPPEPDIKRLSGSDLGSREYLIRNELGRGNQIQPAYPEYIERRKRNLAGLVTAGLWTEAELAELEKEADKYYEVKLASRIGDLKRELVRLEQLQREI